MTCISSSRMPSAASASESAVASLSRAAGLVAQPVPCGASAGRALTGSGPAPRFCGVSGLFGLPLTTTLKPMVSPYM